MHQIPISDKQESLLYNRNERIERYQHDLHEDVSNQIPSPDCVCDYSHYDRWIQAEENLKAGDEYSVSVGSPGCGTINYRITRITDSGDVYGECLSDYVSELEESDVI